MQNKPTGSRHFGVLVLFVAIVILAAAPFSSGAPDRRTGGPGDSNCTVGCHNSFALNSGSGSVSISGPANYEAGQAVDLTVRVALTGARRFGFEIMAKDDSNAHVGTWELTDQNSGFASGNVNYVTHGPAPFVSDENTWTVRWNAPAVLVGDVTFYAAGNAANGDGSNQGDRIYTTSLTLAPNTATFVEADEIPVRFEVLGVFPNPWVERTTISYTLSEVSSVSLELYDAGGRRVMYRNIGVLSAGEHMERLSADGLRTGVYFYRLATRFGDKTGSLFLVR